MDWIKADRTTLKGRKTMRTKKTATPTAKTRKRRPFSAGPDAALPARDTAASTKPAKLSALSAAARVLEETGKAMNCRQLIEAMGAQGYWTSPGGRTPEATLASAMAREIRAKGPQARFRKVERGQFAANVPA
jgi:hypothetical protein